MLTNIYDQTPPTTVKRKMQLEETGARRWLSRKSGGANGTFWNFEAVSTVGSATSALIQVV